MLQPAALLTGRVSKSTRTPNEWSSLRPGRPVCRRIGPRCAVGLQRTRSPSTPLSPMFGETGMNAEVTSHQENNFDFVRCLAASFAI